MLKNLAIANGMSLVLLSSGVLLTGCGGAGSGDGTYTVEVQTNGDGTTGITVTPPTTTPPAQHTLSLTSQPNSATIYEGGSQTFNLAYSNSHPVTVAWLKNGSPISGATGNSLTISSATTAAAGTYSCTVTDGTVSANCNPFTLTVNSIVRITTQPSALTLNAGSSGSLSVAASGTGPISYQWYLNGSAISGATSAQLNLANVSSANQGQYHCVVVNAGSQATTSAVQVTVNAVATGPTVTGELVSLSLKEPAGVARTAETVRTGVPMPKGSLYPNEAISLYSGSTALPTQSKPLSLWDDGSVRWLLLDTQTDLAANASQSLKLNKLSAAPATSGVQIQTSTNFYTVDTGTLKMEIPRTNGSVVSRAWINGTLVIDSTGTALRGPWLKYNNKTYTGGNLQAGEQPLSTDPMAAYLDYVNSFGQAGGFNQYNPYTLNVSVENSGPVHAVVRVSGAFQDTSNNGFSSFIVRLHFYKGSSQIDVDQTLVYTGSETQQVQGYGFALPFAGTQTSIEGTSLATGSLNQLAWNSYSVGSSSVAGQALGYIARSNGTSNVGVILRDMSENFPKGLEATADGLKVNLYPEAAGAWNLARYSDTLDTANGEVGGNMDRGAQGLAKTDRYRVVFGAGTVNNTTLANTAKAMDKGQLLMLASPDWYSNARVMGVGGFSFPTQLAQSEGHYRIDRLLHVVADFMRYNQRKQFNWFGIENYGDIRGDFRGGGSESHDWRGLGRYGWSGNSGEPSNQLWTQFLREPSQDVFLDAEALAKHTLDVQMVHYGDASRIDPTPFNGRNREFAVGSLHRHGRQAFSGYAGLPDYSHVAGVETYYYLTGDERARETLYEAAQFISRYGETNPEYTALNTGLDVLDRAAAVFHDQPAVASRYEDRVDYLMSYLSSGGTTNNLEAAILAESQDLGGQFNNLIRIMPGLLYLQERTGRTDAANLVFDVANIMTAGDGDAWNVATNGATSSVFYHLNLLAYAATIATDHGRSPTPYYNLAKLAVEWNTHAYASADTDAISLTSLARIPSDWRNWTFTWDDDTLTSGTPGILWIDRQITFRNNFLQDYHSYRSFIHLATAAALVPAGEMQLR